MLLNALTCLVKVKIKDAIAKLIRHKPTSSGCSIKDIPYTTKLPHSTLPLPLLFVALQVLLFSKGAFVSSGMLSGQELLVSPS